MLLGEIEQGGMSSNSVIPDGNRAFFPFEPCLEIYPLSDMVVQEVEEVVAFLLFVADYVASELGVYEYSSFASNGMSPNKRMLVLNRISPNHAAPLTRPTEFRLFETRMNRRETFQSLPELGTQSIISFHLVDKDGVTTAWG